MLLAVTPRTVSPRGSVSERLVLMGPCHGSWISRMSAEEVWRRVASMRLCRPIFTDMILMGRSDMGNVRRA